LINATEPTSKGPSRVPDLISSFHSGHLAGSSHNSHTRAASAAVSARASVCHAALSAGKANQIVCPLFIAAILARGA
jgi:hypothetical protein